MTPDQPFQDLLEQYVFAMADRFIEFASPEDQTRLINLYNSISKPLPNGISSVVVSLNEAQECQGELPPKALKRHKNVKATSTKSQLKQPALVDASRDISQRLVAIHQQQIRTTSSSIRQMDLLIERAKSTIYNVSLQTQLLTHYQSIREKYIVRLERLTALQETKLHILSLT